MKPIKTTGDYVSMSSKDMKKFMKNVLRKANDEQKLLLKRYDKAVESGELKAI